MRKRRVTVLVATLLSLLAWVVTTQQPSLATQPIAQPSVQPPATSSPVAADRQLALDALESLSVKGRAAKTGYKRTQFGDGWRLSGGCDMRNIILHRDLASVTAGEDCKVLSGTLSDPYTAKQIVFVRGDTTSALVQIDHVVALSNAWQTGAQQLALEQRIALANDPLELLAVDGEANQKKSDGDAATWLPPNKPFRCQYVARQIAVKKKYSLWVTPAEKLAMQTVLAKCPEQTVI